MSPAVDKATRGMMDLLSLVDSTLEGRCTLLSKYSVHTLTLQQTHSRCSPIHETVNMGTMSLNPPEYQM